MRMWWLVVFVLLMGCQPAETLSTDEARVMGLLADVVDVSDVKITDELVRVDWDADDVSALPMVFCTVWFDASMSSAFMR
ncbi:MAG: hypothetical protein AAF126_22755, partial [Chloroflexota bacterium]